MKWFRKQTAPAGASVQLRETGHHPFELLGQYVPMRSGEIRLYRAVREAVPVVDAAIYKLIRMVGGVTAACSDPAAERGLGEFLRTVGGCEACNYCCEKSDFGKFMFHVISLFEDRFITDYSD